MSAVHIPETKYAKTADGVHIAYQSIGDGPTDLIYLSEWVSNVELQWQEPRHSQFFQDLASSTRLITIDRRGTGLSDRISGDAPTLEASMDDVLAVLDDIGSERAALLGVLDGGSVGALFAATWPERTAALILHGAFARGLPAPPDYPWGWTEEQWQEDDEGIEQLWGTDAFSDTVIKYSTPSLAEDSTFRQWWSTQNRLSMSPGGALSFNRMMREIDLRHVLPSIQAPTLVLHRSDDGVTMVDEGRYVADNIPGARFSELAGNDHPPWAGDQQPVLAEVRRFLASVADMETEFDRVLATVLFTDIVGSTERASSIGDRSWHELLERHHAIVRAMLGRYRGREIATAGDGFFATFDGPARAIRCASAIVESLHPLDIQIRSGLHTGEVELFGDDVRGIAVHIGARVGALAGPSEVLVSQTVKDLVAGSGITFEAAGEHQLKGVPDRWRLYRFLE
jgi:class 3 adenylate cyclase